MLPGELGVTIEVSWILGEVLAGGELERVDEDAGDYLICPLTSHVDQRQVSIVKIAHGGHEPGHLSVTAPFPHRYLELLYLGEDFHVEPTGQEFGSGKTMLGGRVATILHGTHVCPDCLEWIPGVGGIVKYEARLAS